MMEHLCNVLFTLTTTASQQLIKVHGPLVLLFVLFLFLVLL